MGVILKIVAGPLAGRKLYLRVGQTIQVGRTEWADFAVPHDRAMSEVHFALEYDARALRLKDRNTRQGTLVNGERVNEALLGHGDRITAGETTFALEIEGAAPPAAAEPAVVAGAAVAAVAVAATVEGQPRRASGFARVVTPLAAEVCQRFKPDPPALALLRAEQSPRQHFDLLMGQELHADAARFLAYALPKREAAWWGVLAVRHGTADKLTAKDQAALAAAEKWVVEPTEDNRRPAMPAAEATNFDTAAGWATAAAFWSGGSITAPNLPVIPPKDSLTPDAVVLAVKLSSQALGPEAATERLPALVTLGAEVADGKHEWPKPEGADAE